MNVYIPSYLGNCDKRPIREKALSTLLTWLLQNESIRITILAQEWLETDLPKFNISNKINIIHGMRARVGINRNIMLKMFYETNEDYAFFMDDDALGLISNTDMSFWEYLDKYVFPFADKWDSLNFKKAMYKNKVIKNNECFSIWTPTSELCTTMLLIKNFKKKFNLEFYFDETLDALEDLALGLELSRCGLKNYLIENPYCAEVQLSIMFKDREDRTQRNKKAKADIKKLFDRFENSKHLLTIATNGSILKSKFEQKFVAHPKRIIYHDSDEWKIKETLDDFM